MAAAKRKRPRASKAVRAAKPWIDQATLERVAKLEGKRARDAYVPSFLDMAEHARELGVAEIDAADCVYVVFCDRGDVATVRRLADAARGRAWTFDGGERTTVERAKVFIRAAELLEQAVALLATLEKPAPSGPPRPRGARRSRARAG